MNVCYARKFGGCNEISGEHYVSESILRRVSLGHPLVLTRNLTFLAEQKAISTANLTANMLCVAHNAFLSKYDNAGLAFISGVDEMTALMNGLPARQTIQNAISIQVDGDQLERWMLKTLCGGLFSGNFPISGKGEKGFDLPDGWLDILFRDAEFPVGQGLLYIPQREFFSTPDVLKLRVIQDVDKKVIGMEVHVFGCIFCLWLTQIPIDCSNELKQAMFRPTGFVFNGCSKEIAFNWKSGSVAEAVRLDVSPG